MSDLPKDLQRLFLFAAIPKVASAIMSANRSRYQAVKYRRYIQVLKKHFTVINYNRSLPADLSLWCNTAYGHLPDGSHHGKCYLLNTHDNTVCSMTTYDTNTRHGLSIHWDSSGEPMKTMWYTMGLEEVDDCQRLI